MKYSIKKQFKKLFEEEQIQFQNGSRLQLGLQKIGNEYEEFDTYTNFPEINIGFPEDIFPHVANECNKFLSRNNTIALKIDNSRSINIDISNKNIFDLYFVFYKEKIIENVSYIIESVEKVISTQDLIGSFSYKDESGGGNDLLNNLVKSSNSTNFIINIYTLLYRKLVDKKKVNFSNPKYVATNLEVEVNKVIEHFKSQIEEKQQNLSTTFGSTFEVLVENRIKEYLGNRERDLKNTTGIIKKHVSKKDKDLNQAQKKASILLLLVLQGKFSNTAFYNKLTGNSTTLLTDSEWIDCFSTAFEDIEVSSLNQLDILINEYAKLLEHNKDEVLCKDYENDNVIYDGCKQYNEKASDDDKINIPKSSAYFDFIIRTKNLESTDLKVGLFDLKCTNSNVSENRQPITIGATGNNKGNKAIKNVFNTIRALNNHSEKVNTKIVFLGLAQIEYSLETNDKVFKIKISNLKHAVNTVNEVIRLSADQRKIKVKSGEHENPAIDLKDHVSIENIGEIEKKYNIKYGKNLSLYENYNDFINKLITLDYNGNIEDSIKNGNQNDYLELLSICFENPSVIYDFKNNTTAVISALDSEKEFRDENDGFLDLIEKVKNDINLDLKSLVFKFVGFSLFDEDGFFKEKYTSLSTGYPKQNFKRNIARCILSVLGRGNKKENVLKFLDSLENARTEELRQADKKQSFQDSPQRADDYQFPNLKRQLKGLKSRKRSDRKYYLKRYFSGSIIKRIDDIITNHKAQTNQDQEPQNVQSSYLPHGKVLREVYVHLFKKKLINEGGLAGHMMHPYEALDMTPRQIIDRIKEYSTSQSIIEKVDGQNLFFTVEQDGTLMFARNKADMTHNDLVEKFTNHPAEVPFVTGGNAIKKGVDQWISSAGAFGQQEILDIFHPDGEARSFINFEIMHKDHPNQLEYGENFIVFHSIVDFINGREAVYSSNNSQRLEKLISLMKQGIESLGYTLASNRTVDLNKLTNVQILSYIKRVNEIANQLEITDSEFLGDGVEKQIKKQLDTEGVNISDEAIKILYDFALYGEDRSGNKIKSKDFTSLMKSEDIKKLRAIDLTNANKAAAKVRRILAPFKEVFVDLGIDLLDGVPSAYMDSETDLANIERLRDKLETAIEDLRSYMSSTPESNWNAEVNRLKAHYDKIEEVGIYNAVSTSVEGGVYDFEGDLLKVTGGFAPLNQILGAAYRDKKGIFSSFREKFIQQESNRRSLKSIFNLIF